MKNSTKIILALSLMLASFGITYADWGLSELIKEGTNTWFKPWFIWIMLPAALADSINPCAFAVMFILLNSVLTNSKSTTRVILTGLSFVTAIFISYFVMWLGLFSALASSTSAITVQKIAWTLWIIVWLLNLKDFFWYGKWGFAFWVPKTWKPAMFKIVSGITSPIGAFFIWILISLFLLPCTSGPYITITSMISASWTEHFAAILYLLIYNLIFILPLIGIILLVATGFASVKDLQKKRNQNIRLIHGVIWLLMLGLGLYIFWSIYS